LKKTLLQHWPLYASVLILSLLLWLILAISFSQNQGHLVYALDDAYIHMAMARNFSHYGVWGVTRYGFTSSSSSILWTLLLSLTYYLFGVSQIAPLLWNLVFAVLVLGVAYAILTWYKLPPALKLAALLAIIFLIPLPTLILSGLEQNLQALLAMLATFLAARMLSGEAPTSASRDSTLLLVLAPLVTAVRFEGMFLILAICGLLLLRKRWFYALAFGVCGFLPVVIYGIISVSHGWFWFPSSVLLKGVMPDLTSLSGLFLSLAINAFINLHLGLHVFVLLIAVLLFYVLACGKGRGVFDSRQVMGAILLGTAFPHVEFVQVGPLFRYDAYLFALAVLFLASQLPIVIADLPARTSFSRELVPQYLAAGALALLLFFPLAVKGSRLLWFLPQCTTNIFEQQYQMGSFARQYYQGSTVALNDVGAVNFLADIHCLDLWGLANRDVTALKREHNYHTRDIAGLSKQAGARIAIVYDYWYAGEVGGLPAEWVRVGQWTIRNNVIAGGDMVSFYALDPSEVSRLSQCLREFSLRLPRDVIENGSYLEWRSIPATP
jgi:hypothetical protein